MHLYWHGGKSVTLVGGDHSLKIDPPDLGKELKSAKAVDVVLLSQNSAVETIAAASPFVVDNPGEYDVKGFFILGLGGFAEGTVYIIETDGVRLCHLDGVNRELTDPELEGLADIDILIVDTGLNDDANETAAKIVGQIEPRIVIPVGHDPTKKPDTFLKEMGASEVEPVSKVVIKKKDLPTEETRVILLNAVK